MVVQMRYGVTAWMGVMMAAAGLAACAADGELTMGLGAGVGGGPVGGVGGTAGVAGAAGSSGLGGTGGTGGLQVGPGGTGGTGGMQDAGPTLADAGAGDAAVDAGTAEPKPICLQKPSQVALIGDSYINWVSHAFPADLFKEAGQTYRNYAIGAYSMGSGGVGLISTQLDTMIAEDPDAVALVMTGGGNDVLVADTMMFPQGGDCKMSTMSPTIPDCQKIVDKAIAAAQAMLDESVVKLPHSIIDVVYFFYPVVPEGTLVGGTHPNEILEYAYPIAEEFCDGTFERTNGKVRCHFVDLRPVFMGHPEYFAPTDIHPSLLGSAAMAKAVWKVMKDNCIAQPASSGCCEP
jgi:hypothetical protein